MQKGLPAKQYKSQNKQLPSCQLQLVSGHYKADVEHAGKNTKSPSLAEGKTYPPCFCGNWDPDPCSESWWGKAPTRKGVSNIFQNMFLNMFKHQEKKHQTSFQNLITTDLSFFCQSTAANKVELNTSSVRCGLASHTNAARNWQKLLRYKFQHASERESTA